MFVASAFQVLMISWGADMFAREHAGFVGGVASGAYGAGLALLMPLFGRLFDAQRYGIAFALAALCPVIGYACFRLLAAQRDEPGPDADQRPAARRFTAGTGAN
jgi:predicted MFS family arabinose efflux permease